MSTGISLIRENTASMQPPRALWVPFPLGRPLGASNNPEFQHQVIAAALALLGRPSGPVLEDFPHDAPGVEPEQVAACPVAFPKTEETDDNSWSARLLTEHALLQPWYELSLRRRAGRTLVGISEFTVVGNLTRLGELLDQDSWVTDIKWLKPAVEDLKAFTMESMTAQPGDYDATAIQTQFWQDTILGAAILALYEHYQNAEDDRLRIIARMLAPREAAGGRTGPEGDIDA